MKRFPVTIQQQCQYGFKQGLIVLSGCSLMLIVFTLAVVMFFVPELSRNRWFLK